MAGMRAQINRILSSIPLDPDGNPVHAMSSKDGFCRHRMDVHVHIHLHSDKTD